MAFAQGNASNFDDLFGKLISFLTGNPALVQAGQAWQLLYRQKPATFDGKVPTNLSREHAVLRSTGLSGEDQIFTAISSFGDTAQDHYNFRLVGASGWTDTALVPGAPWVDQGLLGKSPPVQALFWNQPMTYWFFANGRRFFAVVKVSTVYTSFGAGFILPAVSPRQYPYPHAVWGSYHMQTTDPVRWSDTSDRHRGLTTPAYASMFLRQPGGRWADFYGRSNSNGQPAVAGGNLRYVMPCGVQNGTAGSANTYLEAMRDTLGGGFPLIPVTLMSLDSEGRATYGEADGLFWVPTQNNGSEDEIVVNGIKYIVFQSVFRTSSPNLFALRAD